MKKKPGKNDEKMIKATTIDAKKAENHSKFQKNDIRSLFCYGNANIKNMIWSLKTNSQFFKSSEGVGLIGALIKEISSSTIIICAPSSSFWQNRRNFDPMHILIKSLVKKLRQNNNISYIPHAIIPRLNKNLQKELNKRERQNQTIGAYSLSNYFKYHLRQRLLEKTILAFEILIIDDVKTTGSTLIECRDTVERYVNSLSSENNKADTTKLLSIRCLTIAYEA